MLLALLILPSPLRAESAVEFLGSFSHERRTAEHYYGYRLDLWREGAKVFGFYASNGGLQGDGVRGGYPWRIAGDLKGNSVLIKSEHVNFIFSGNLSENNLSGRWTDSMEKIELALQKLPATGIEPALLKASLGSYESWARWAEQFLDRKDADNRQLSQNLTNCSSGDGAACLAAGNHSKLRGNQETARQLYETGCRLNDATSCFNIGRVERARGILESRCTGEATMQNNFACEALGKLEEKAGHLMEAKEWYRKGCNDSIPKVCPDFKRLEERR